MQELYYPALDTPAVLIHLEKLDANIREMSQLAVEAGVKLRPHIKVHESAVIAKLQIEAGASAIEVGTLDQAESMVEEGINDILVAHPFYGKHKLETLKRLLNKPKLKLAVVVDMFEQAEGISLVGRELSRKVPVYLKIDVTTGGTATYGVTTGGLSRFGVPPGEPALNLAKKLCQLLGTELVGIYAHEMGEEPTQQGVDKTAFETASIMAEVTTMFRREGIPIEHVSTGASPTFRSTCRYIKEGKFPEITEIHPGSCVIGDMSYVGNLGNTEETCALTVLTTVVSTSHPHHAVIDAGSKTFGADSLIARREMPGFFWQGKPSFGSIQGRPDLWLGLLSAEGSIIYYMNSKKKLSLGQRLEIVPNNSIIVINIHSQLYGVRNGVVEKVFPVTGRGRGN